jgi:hypothetical protein
LNINAPFLTINHLFNNNNSRVLFLSADNVDTDRGKGGGKFMLAVLGGKQHV